MGLSNPKLSAFLFDLVGLWWRSWWISGGFLWRCGLFWRWFVWQRGLGGGCGGHCWLRLVWWFVCVCSVNGLMVCVCVCVALLMVWWFMFVCECGSVCVVMNLDRLICVSWVFVCVALCVEPVLEVEGEREEKEKKKRNSKKKE